jgi:hypothetical protein
MHRQESGTKREFPKEGNSPGTVFFQGREILVLRNFWGTKLQKKGEQKKGMHNVLPPC